METEGTPEQIARRVRLALDSGDLGAMGDLLHPDAKWGAPDDPNPSCQNRKQVLAWYRQGQDRGVNARVIEVVVNGDKILLGVNVTGAPADEADRWQVMTVLGGQITDIRGFDNRVDAQLRAGVRPGAFGY